MCGIFVYKGSKPVVPFLTQGLLRLEYRGYDSAGLVCIDPNGRVESAKAVGKVSALTSLIASADDGRFDQPGVGIAHTRRATHGAPTQTNTHPHTDTAQRFWVVHNGIIENYHKLKTELQAQGYVFVSQTDTEVVAHLLAHHRNGDFVETVEAVIARLTGSYALAILCADFPDQVIAVKRGSPLIVAQNPTNNEFFFSSDMQALAGFVDHTTILQDGDLVHIYGDRMVLKNEGAILKREEIALDVDAMEASKNGHPTFMHKEIYEQPVIIQRTRKGRIDFLNHSVYSNSIEVLKDKDIRRVVFVACGTSYHAGMLGALRFGEYTDIDASAVIASEYAHQRLDSRKTTLHVIISQSGETADSLDVLKSLKSMGCLTCGIVNSVGSSIASMTDCGYFLRAGFEIGVASTKAFSAQAMSILFLMLSFARKSIKTAEYHDLFSAIETIPGLMSDVLGREAQIATVARELSQYGHCFFLGRGLQVPIAAEGSLKYKEISYIHSERYPTGELKHGALALIQEDFPSVMLMPNDHYHAHNASSLQEIKARKGKVCVISDQSHHDADRQIAIPSAHPLVMPFVTTVAVQLLAYHCAQNLGRDIDKPRNLAKSVTVR